MLWRIRASDETWLYLLVLIEFQSTVDRRMALRMMDYTVRVLQGLGNDDLGAGGEYPPILPIVIYNGERRRREGLQLGRVEGERELVYRLVTRRFCPGIAEQIASVLRVPNPERAAAVADAVIECETAEEFLARAREATLT